MNITQLFNLKASLIASRVRLADAIEEVQHAIDEALAPDAGMVVVQGDDYTVWEFWTRWAFIHPSWENSRLVETAWQHRSAWQHVVVFPLRPGSLLDLASPSHLTIADGRGEGEVEGIPPSHRLRPWWCGYDPDCLPVAMLNSPLATGEVWAEVWAYNHDYSGVLLDPWWHPDESTTIDCAAVPHAMTWRAA